jgi:hypothetical protein
MRTACLSWLRSQCQRSAFFFARGVEIRAFFGRAQGSLLIVATNGLSLELVLVRRMSAHRRGAPDLGHPGIDHFPAVLIFNFDRQRITAQDPINYRVWLGRVAVFEFALRLVTARVDPEGIARRSLGVWPPALTTTKRQQRHQRQHSHAARGTTPQREPLAQCLHHGSQKKNAPSCRPFTVRLLHVPHRTRRPHGCGRRRTRGRQA